MSESHIAILPDRSVVSVGGADARGFLDNLITNDMDLLDRQDAIHAALLTPQGKILFEFFVVRQDDGFLLETARASAAELIKRLALYKLRSKVVLDNLSGSKVVAALWGPLPAAPPLAAVYRDPRHAGLGFRLIMPHAAVGQLAGADEGQRAYERLRIALGVPEAGRDYPLGDTFPHEACFDRLAGVSFTKGCFVGQEVVARMQHKTVVRKRVVGLEAGASLIEEGDVRAGEAVIGRVGSTDGGHGLALLRLDRALEARRTGQALTVNGTPVIVDAGALDAYEAATGASHATPP